MFLKSLQSRLVSIFILLVVFLIIPIGLFLNKSVESSYYDTFVKEVESGFNNWSIKGDVTVEDMIYYLEEEKNAIALFHIFESRSYSVINRKNISDIKYSSDSIYNNNPEKFVNEILSSENIISVMAGSPEGKSKHAVYANSRRFFDYARAISLRDDDYILYFRLESEAWSGVINKFNTIILSSLFLSIIFSLIIGYFLSKAITTPVIRIMHRAQRLASGEFDQVLEVKTDDEIGKLTRAFNFMAKSLKDTLGEISMEKNKVETILNYITDGIIAFDIKGNIIHNNPASRSMLGFRKFDFNYEIFSRRYGLDMSIDEIIQKNKNLVTEHTILSYEKVYKVHFAVFFEEQNKPEGVIAVIHDITEQARLDNMRKEFVANVSHELRTPLTSIKSYSETLINEVKENNSTFKRFLNVINHEADRMTRIVKDLLELSRLDNQQLKWNMKQISMKELVCDCIDKLKIEALHKHQEINLNSNENLPDIPGDHDRLEQVILNILSNAIKYTQKNGRIAVKLSRTNNHVVISINDTGIGIPKNDIPRIFERFYRVDKARSREMGGTGLGLAIAREIVEAHSGLVSIESETGKGTEVTVKLPICLDKANAV
jgi:two-component system, OmpR family, sensor histidine kinase VicK